MEYWSEMPAGMLLRSPWHASSISDPDDALTLDAYEETLDRRLSRPVELDEFVAYGRWFAAQVAPSLDERRVVLIESADDRLRLQLEDGETVIGDRVVLATGLLGAAHRPSDLAGLPSDRLMHTSDLRDPAGLAGKRVLVVGGGQSATESAALLHEAGAGVEIVMRAKAVNWLGRSARLHASRLRPLFYPDTDVGPPVLNQIVNKPRVFRSFPPAAQEAMAYRSIRPAAAAWLRPRLEEVPITHGRHPVGATMRGDEVVVQLDDGSERPVDVVVAGTGFRLDVTAHPLLATELAARVRARDGYPRLDRGYESSVPGLHFVGALAAKSQGPVMRFVSGTWLTAPAVARRVVARHQPRRATAESHIAVADARQPAS
jgi:thioredoxin reductase